MPVPSSSKSPLLPIARKLSVAPPCNFIAFPEPKVIFSLPESIRTFVDLISSASIVNPPIVPPVNKTFEPVICPLSFSFKIVPTDIVPSETTRPPISPPSNERPDAVTWPPAETLKLLEDIKETGSLTFVDEDISYAVPELNFVSPIVSPPISPSAAVTLPDIITLPSLSKWKFEELISILPKEPLTNWVGEPKKKAEDDIKTLSPSKDKWAPAASPAKNFALLSLGFLPCIKMPLFVPPTPVGSVLPNWINPPWLELINKFVALNLNWSTSTEKTEAVTLMSSEAIFTTSPSKNM